MIDTKNPSKLYNPAVPYEIDQISIGGKRRPLNETKVVGLMESIRECGLINPITITIPKGAKAVLVAGYHRLAACKRLGWKQIPTQVLHTQYPLLVELAEIDENLIRNELTPLEMADSLKRRKEIYEKLHPPSKKGGDHTSEAGKQNVESTFCFVKDTAAKTGKSESTIQQNVKIATDLTKGVKEKIAGTPIAEKKEELKALASVPKSQQAKVVEKVLSGQASSVRAAVEPKKQEVKFGIKICRERKCPELRKNENTAYPEDAQERCQVFNSMPGTLHCCIKDPAIPPDDFLHHALWNLHADWEKSLKINRKTPGPKNCPASCPYKISEIGEVFGKTGAGRYEKKPGTIWKCAFVGAELGSGLAGLCPCHVLDNPKQEDQIKLLTTIIKVRKELSASDLIGNCHLQPCPDGEQRCKDGKDCPVIRVPFHELKECPLWRIPAKMLPAAPAVAVQKNTFNATPPPGSIPVTEGPLQPSLKERILAGEEVQIPGMIKSATEPGIIPAPKPNPCRDFHPAQRKKQQFVCPDLDNHLVVEETRGRICTVLNVPIGQLPGNECPLERTQRLKGTAPESPKPVWKCGAPCPDGKDHTAGDKCKILGTSCKQIPQHQCPIICDPFTGGKIIKSPPYKITKAKLLDSERDAMVDALLERTQFTPKDIEQIDELVKINREGWSCRYDVIEAAVMMLLAKAEGE